MADKEYRKTLNSLMSSIVNSAFSSDVIEELPCMVMVFEDATGEIVGVNKLFCDYLGYTKEELIGKICFDLVTDLPKTIDAWANFTKNKSQPPIFINEYKAKNGENKQMCWITDFADRSEIKGYTYGLALKEINI